MDFGVDAFDVFDEENDNEAEVIPSAIDSETTDTKYDF